MRIGLGAGAFATAPAGSAATNAGVLVLGAGPAGLACAMELSKKGRKALVFFGYTYCPDICPVVLFNVGKALEDEIQAMMNGKKKGSGNAKCGNRYLSWAWIEAANFAIRFSPEIRRWFDRKASKKPRPVAIKSVAHKLARAGYHLIKDGGHFDVKRAFG